MIVDPANAAAVYSQQKEPVIPDLTREQPRPQPPAAQLAQTHAGGQAVVANFSAAALLTSKATSAPQQSADQEPVRKEGGKTGSSRPHPAEEQERGSRVDVRI